MVVHTVWVSVPEKSYEYGPFYFCSANCREGWKQWCVAECPHFNNPTFRDDIEETDSTQCDQCSGPI